MKFVCLCVAPVYVFVYFARSAYKRAVWCHVIGRGPTGNSNYRGISADIINNALLNSTDYTGVVNADGTKAHK